MSNEKHPLNVLIVDDEPLARQLMRLQLSKCSQEIRAYEAASVALAKTWLLENACDIILLDIHMPDVTGIEFAEELQNIKKEGTYPFIIFVTADSAHALKAFDLAALDYLTKPVSLDRLEKTLQRVQKQLTPRQIKGAEDKQPFIIIESQQQILRIPLDQVLYFQADNKYTLVACREKTYLTEDSLSSLEQQYASYVTRVHRSYLITNKAIKKLVRQNTSLGQEAWFIELYNTETLVPVSRRQLSTVKKLLSGASSISTEQNL